MSSLPAPDSSPTSGAAGALAGVRVLDLTHYLAGPYATKLMAGYGAEVIKVERPGSGDPSRAIGPFVTPHPDPETSIPFLYLNTGKLGVTLDLKRAEGREIFTALVRQADVLVESFAPRVMPGLGFSYETLRAVNPRLVMTSISNFGQSGPYRDYRAAEIVEYALSGLMALTGDPARAPLASGPAMTQATAGMCAYVGTLTALFQRGRTGEGRHVDVSIHEAAVDNVEIAFAEYLHAGTVAKRKDDHHALVPWELYPCRDGYAALIGGPVRHWLPANDLFGEPLLAERYPHMADRLAHRPEVEALLRPWALRKDKKEIYHAGQGRKLAFGYLATLDDVVESPQHAAREFFEPIDHPVAGQQRYCGAPFHPARTPWRSDRAPLLGEHNARVFGDLLGYSAARVGELRASGVL